MRLLKAELIEGATDLLANTLGKNPETTIVVTDEFDTDSWVLAGSV
jgi:4-oxalocrotonate tautomerase